MQSQTIESENDSGFGNNSKALEDELEETQIINTPAGGGGSSASMEEWKISRF